MNTSQITKKLFVGFNWKMNPNSQKHARELFQIYDDLNVNPSFLPVVFVPHIYLYPIQMINFNSIDIGSQDISDKISGAFTGQTSGQMLKDLGCKYSLINHSETNRDFNLDFEINLFRQLKIK
jgi:triosephosphate isomerase (TIM)